MLSKNISAVLLLGLTSSFLACAPGSAPSVTENNGSHGRPIIGGSQASSYPEAVLVDMSKGGQQTAACSGSLIAPRVVLTAGHCVHGFDGWSITAPYASGQTATATSGLTLDWNTDAETVDPNAHDIGLVFLDTEITLQSYPTLADAPVADGSQVINVGRIDNGQFSSTDLFASQPTTVNNATGSGYPFDYVAAEVIQSGDSGGPDFTPGTHTIVAVNSGAGGGTEVLARVDLVLGWIQQQIAAHGGSGNPGGTGSGGSGGTGGSGGAGGAPGAGGAGGAGGNCGGVTYEGDCQGNVVEWCDGNGALQQLDCAPSGTTCGWDQAAGFYNCI